MAENLAYKAGSGSWIYDNNSSNVSKYGYLYNYKTAKNVCPSGYHLPTKAEYETLLDNYGGRNDSKANYTALIPSGNSGFSALFGGWSDSNGDFYGIVKLGYFWSSSTKDEPYAWKLYVYSSDKKAYMNSSHKSSGFSVRCVQDN